MRKVFKKLIACALALCMLTGLVPTGLGSLDVYAASTTDDQWEEVQSIVSQYYGEWKDTSYSEALTSQTPDTALLGNGDVGITSYGNESEQTFLISKGDFWTYNYKPILAGGVTIGDQFAKGDNLSPTAKSVTASSVHDGFNPEYATDGVIPSYISDSGYWVSKRPQDLSDGSQGTVDDEKFWLQLEFKEPVTVGRYVVKSDAYVRGSAQDVYTTSDWQVQVSDDGTDWRTVSSITGNSKASRDVNLSEQATAKYVRLYITKAGQETTDNSKRNPRARIVEFELYEEAISLSAQAKKVTASSVHDGFNPEYATDGVIPSDISEGGYWVSKRPQDLSDGSQGTVDDEKFWLQLEFKEPVTVGRYVVKSDAYVRGSAQDAYTTSDWQVQVSENGTDWETVSTVTGNAKASCEKSLSEQVNTKYVRLYITKAGQETTNDSKKNPRARIVEFELYEDLGTAEEVTNLALEKTVEVCCAWSNNTSALGGSKLVDGNIKDTSSKWCSLNTTSEYSKEHWAILNLGEEKEIGWYELSHENGHITKGWKLQYLPSGTTVDWDMIENLDTWQDMASAENNTEVTNSGTLENKITTQYVKLVVTDPCGNCNNDTTVRVHELELRDADPTGTVTVEEEYASAESATVSVCCEYDTSGNYGASKLTDGVTTTSSKWNTKATCDIVEPHYAEFDLGTSKTINYYEVYHDTGGHKTVAFELQYKDSNGNWVTADSVSGNTESETKKTLNTSVSAQYWRLLVTDPDPDPSDNCARINEVKLMDYENGTNYTSESEVTVCCKYENNENYGASKLKDDDTTTGSKWNTKYVCDIVVPHYAEFDLGTSKTINYYEVYHDTGGHKTVAFELQYKDSNGNWVTADSVSGNTESETKKTLNTSVSAQYWRLLVTDPDPSDNYARINEVKLMNTAVTTTVETTNYASSAEVKACGALTDNNVTYAGSNLVDGNKTASKWCSKCYATEHHWAIVDLGEEKEVGYYEVYHAGSDEPKYSKYNTVAFKLQYKDSNSNWITADSVSDNEADATKKELGESIKARYWRLLVTDPAKSDDTVRIQELVLMNEKPEERTEEDTGDEGSGGSSSTKTFYEKQDILNAEIQTKQTLVDTETEMKTWLSADKNIMVTELTSKGTEDAKMRVTTWASMNGENKKPVTVSSDESSVTVTRCTENLGKNVENGHVSQVALSTKIIGADNVEVSNAATAGKGFLDFTLEAGKTVYIVTAIGGGGRTYKNDGTTLWEATEAPATEAQKLLASVTRTDDINALNEERLAWWKDFWCTSYISLDTNDERLSTIQKYYYGAQYLLGSASKEGEVAPGLYGIWHTNDSASFDSDYHMNYNFMGTFYGTYSSNRPELALNAVQALLDYMPEGERRASSVNELKEVNSNFVEQKIQKGDIDAQKGIEDALLFPVGIGPWGMTCDDVYLGEIMDAAYNSYLITQYYEYTMDKDFLEDGAYDFMKKAVALYEAWLEKEELTENSDDYEYVIYAAYNEGSWARNPIIELAALKNTLSHLIEYSELLGKDADKREKWIDIYKHLSDQPTVEVNGKTVLTLGDWIMRNGAYLDLTNPCSASGGNILPLDTMIPGNIYNYFSSAEDLQMVRDTLELYTSQGKWAQKNNFPRIFQEAVKANYDIDKVVDAFANEIKKQMKANLRIRDNTHGVEKIGATEAVNAMLLASEQDENNTTVAKVFPNWFEDKDAKFVNLRARGAFVISAEYDGDAKEAVEGISVTNEAGETLNMVIPWGEGVVVKDENGNKVSITLPKDAGKASNGELTFSIAIPEGKTYTLWKPTTEEVQAVNKDIRQVAELSDITVEYGTEFSAVDLPETVKVTLYDGTEKEVAVTWTAGTYDGSKADTYTLTGTLAEGDGYTNSLNLTATLNVIVKEKASDSGSGSSSSSNSGFNSNSGSSDKDTTEASQLRLIWLQAQQLQIQYLQVQVIMRCQSHS